MGLSRYGLPWMLTPPAERPAKLCPDSLIPAQKAQVGFLDPRNLGKVPADGTMLSPSPSNKQIDAFFFNGKTSMDE